MVCSFVNYYFLRPFFNGMHLYFFRRKDGQDGQRCRWWWCRDKCRFQVMVFKAILVVAWIAYLKYSSKGFLALGATLAYRNILTDHWNDYLISPPGVWVAVWLISRWKSASARCRRLWGTHLRIQHFVFSFSRVEHGEEETQLDDSLVVLDKCKWKRQRVHTICTVRILVGIRLRRSTQKKWQSIAYLNVYCDVCVLLDQECYLEQYSFLILVLEFTSRQLWPPSESCPRWSEWKVVAWWRILVPSCWC